MKKKELRRHTIDSSIFDGWSVFNRRSRRERKVKDMSGSLHVGLAALGAAIGVGLIGMAASSAVGRNPGASTKILVQSILAIAFAEAIVFYALFLVR
jgi:F-type H+-transporting ATPase subunit c